ncbi:uncharacterized protein LOC117282287 [Cryptotermes secundus]|uniref:uncharacterized protein LOC117282287 n=1 Tax=Cryptotermes secundus TaxID=105785 RepID=UPI001454CD18|nr:uncharacterized protein LOC117282287 [Cryptotermes secundus]
MINNISVIINGLVTSNNSKVLNSDILHSYESAETVEANARNEKEAPKEKVADSAASASKNKGNHTILIIGDSHVRRCASKLRENLDKTYKACDSPARDLK